MSRLLWIIILAIWIIFLSWIWWFFTCGPNAAGAGNENCGKVTLNDGNLLSYEDHGNIKFLRSSPTLIISDNYTDNALATVNNHLIEHDDRSVTITGYYESSEAYNSSTYTNLGEARADQIRQLFLENGIKENQLSIRGNQYEAECIDGDTMLKAATFAFGAIQ